MKKNYFTCSILIILFSLSAQAQQKGSSSGTSGNQSQLVISAGLGNNPYKIENSKGGTSGGAYFKPGIAYYHKSGLSISAYTFALIGPSSNGLFEYDLTPGYDFNKGKAFSFGFSYTRYFFNSNSSIEASPLRNEFYGYVSYNNVWIQPTLAIDAETGSYTDSLGVAHSASDGAVIFSLTHQFTFTSLLNQQDELDISPVGSLLTGTDKFVRSFGSTRFIRHIITTEQIIKRKKTTIPLVSKKKRKTLYTSAYNNEQGQFLPRLLEASLDLDYTIGNFSFEPQYYYDIPLVQGEMATGFFLITCGYSF